MKKLLLTLLMAFAAASPAFAHRDPAVHGSFGAGFTHPLTGADHLLAMVAVGLWASLIGGRALWVVPSAFVAAIASASLPRSEVSACPSSNRPSPPRWW